MISNDTVELLAEFGIRLDDGDLVVLGWSLNLRDIRSANVARITTAATAPILMITSGALCVLSSFGTGGGTHRQFGTLE